jgi:ubiquinone/menaquinone biosynthesis C-methylase UbiE
VRILKTLSGYEEEQLPNIAFRLMSFVISIRDLLFPVGKRLDRFGIRQGFYVVDVGCGPGSYIARASQLVGDRGKVYAVDVHPLAIRSIEKKSKQEKLHNVVPILSTGYPVDIESRSVDVIYALDMFHHIKDTNRFFSELHRILKQNGSLFIESGHQSIDEARTKILNSGHWAIVNEERNLFECIPKGQGNA